MNAEELNPKDLRIGNFVNYKYFNPHPENTEYCFTKVVIRGVYESSIRISFPKQKHIEKVSKVYGIPLSEEVLLKCGFFYDIDSDTFKVSNCTLQIDINGLEIPEAIVFGEVLIHMKYLHQLQNLYYALTGEELEVAL